LELTEIGVGKRVEVGGRVGFREVEELTEEEGGSGEEEEGFGGGRGGFGSGGGWGVGRGS